MRLCHNSFVGEDGTRGKRAIYLCNEVDASSRSFVSAGGYDPPLQVNISQFIPTPFPTACGKKAGAERPLLFICSEKD